MVVASILLALLLWAAPASAGEWPVLFVHGFCSSSDTWNETLPQLSNRRYGDDVPRVFESAIGKAAMRTSVSARAKTFRIDFSDLANGFDPLAIANVPTVRKAGELKVVHAIKRLTDAPRVIVVAHSLGGLATRAYIQGIGRNRNGATIADSGDVAALIMISTPNQGSVLASLSGKPGSDNCTLAETANLQDLQPTSPFLQELNQQPWPAGTAVHSIVSNNAGFDSDDVVTVTSQDLTELPQSRAVRDARRWLQAFQRNGILHLRVHNESTTVALMSGIITDVDNSSAMAAAAAAFFDTTITWCGIPPSAGLTVSSRDPIARPAKGLSTGDEDFG
jgi:pimeloyl-ACP methyl ester carboxylesterase